MPYIITADCVGCKYAGCLKVCPADCIYGLSENETGEVQAYINNEECIDCNACVIECFAGAIFEQQDLPKVFFDAIEINLRESIRIRAAR